MPIFRQNGQLQLFWSKFAQNGFLVGNSECYSRNKNTILEIQWMPIFRQNGQLWLFRSKFAQKWILRLKIEKTNSGIRTSILEIPCVPIFIKNGQLWVFGPKFAQKWILGSKFQKYKSGFRISASKILCDLLSVKMDDFEFFDLNLGKLSNYITWDILDRILLRVLQRAEWRLKWAGWRWV